ncbi:MAG: N-acetylmuramoyl-L-alanine amidase [Oscillospiraceae bacterium]|nr:N-acetylmuramoyl-L-alanine amidase [Oscillospiraceae bacterium]
MDRKRQKRPLALLLAMVCILGLLAGCSAGNLLHLHRYAESLVEATCTQDGYTLFTCSCGDSYRENIITASGHSYQPVTVVEPTYISKGYTISRCSVCGTEYEGDYTWVPEYVVSELAQPDYLEPFMLYSRERTEVPEFVMLHFSSAVVLDQEDPYNMETNRGIFIDYQVSTHYIIDREGNIYCYIPEDLVAYHAGYGSWPTDPKYTDFMNDWAIGIEILGIGTQQEMRQYLSAGTYWSLDPSFIGYTDAQYEALHALVTDICQRNNIPMDRDHVIGHSEYSPQKVDPGSLLDWDRVLFGS